MGDGGAPSNDDPGWRDKPISNKQSRWAISKHQEQRNILLSSPSTFVIRHVSRCRHRSYAMPSKIPYSPQYAVKSRRLRLHHVRYGHSVNMLLPSQICIIAATFASHAAAIATITVKGSSSSPAMAISGISKARTSLFLGRNVQLTHSQASRINLRETIRLQTESNARSTRPLCNSSGSMPSEHTMSTLH
ncbi:hypothetical protein MRB53_038199 [Persea americana]|nr:hypothetical protein MRB53_038199 [Persea americana]